MPTTAAQHVTELLASYPNFPEPGVVFRDLNPLFADARAFRTVVDDIAATFEG